MASYQQGGQCYPTPKAAALAWSTEVPIQDYANASAGCAWIGRPVITGTDDAPIATWTWNRTAGGCASPAAQVVPYTAQPCLLIDHADAAQMAWGVGAAWIIAWAVGSYLRKLVS